MKIILFLILLIGSNLLSKEVFLNGRIVNQDNNSSIPYVSISIKGTFIGTYSDLNGNFRIKVPAGNSILEFYHVSYYSKDIPIATGKNDSLFLLIKLEEKTEQLGVITVEAPKEESLSHFILTTISMKNLPAMGEADIMRAVDMLPGIQITNDYKIQPSIRGGSPDQTEYILDGVEVYYPQHFRGIFSAFNLWAIDHVNVYTANFPAQYYGKLSGIIEFNTPTGNFSGKDNTKSHKTSANISLVSSSIASQLQQNNNFFAISLRRTYLDYIFSIFKYKLPYYFYDMNFKWEHKLNKNWSSSFLFFKNKDEVKFNSSRLSWGNEIRKIGLNYHNNFFQQKLILANSNFVTHTKDNENENKLDNKIENFIVRYRIKKYFSQNVSEIGTEFRRTSIHYFWRLNDTLNPDKLFYKGVPYRFNGKQTANLYRIYFFNSFILKKEKILFDTKMDCISYKLKKSYISAGFELNYKYDVKNALYFAAEKQYQFIAAGAQGIEWSMNSPLFLLNNALNSFMLTFGLTSKIIPNISVKMEFYKKKYGRIVRLQNSFNHFPDFNYGNGQTFGADLLISKKKGRITFQIGYSLNQSYVTFNNEKYSPDWYIPQSFKGLVGFRFGKTWLLSVASIYRSGLLYSKPIKSFFTIGDNGDNEYNNFDYNRVSEHFISERTPTSRFNPYSRLDISIKKEYKSKYFNWYLYLQVYNVTNHSNPLRVDWSRFYSNGTGSAQKGYELNMPLIPTIGAEFIFK